MISGSLSLSEVSSSWAHFDDEAFGALAFGRCFGRGSHFFGEQRTDLMVIVALPALQRTIGNPADEHVFLEFKTASFAAGFNLQKKRSETVN